jgi:hypothetical protein
MGILKDVGNGYLSPNEEINRGQVAEMLSAVLARQV